MIKNILSGVVMFLLKLNEHNRQASTHDLLKFLAIITMTVDHIGYYFYDDYTWLRIIGRMAAPIFFFVVGTAEHFKFKYTFLFWGMLITLIDYYTDTDFCINILVSFVIIRAFLNKYDPSQWSDLKLLIFFTVLILLNEWVDPWLEYGTIGLLFALSGNLISRQDTRGQYVLLATVALYFYIESSSLEVFTRLSYTSGLIAICCMLLALCSHFTLKPIAIPKPATTPMLSLARYSLNIYLFQVVLGDLGLWRLLSTL